MVTGTITRAQLALRTAGDTPPMPSWHGRRVEWAPWRDALVPLCPSTQMEMACRACGSVTTGRTAVGTIHPLDGDHTLVDGRLVPTGPVRSLSAHQCPDCGDYGIIHLGADAVVETIVCDGCDRVCGAGATTEEARAALTADGGQTGSRSDDYDLCPHCLPRAAT